MKVVLYFVAGLLAAAAIVVIGLRVVANSHRPEPGVVVLQPPVVTPLPRDSGPKNNTRRKQTTRRSGPSTKPLGLGRPEQQSRTRTGARSSPSPVETRPAPRRKAKRPAAPQRPSQPPQTTNPQPSPQKPPPVISVNPPVGPTVCHPLLSVRCP